MRAKRIPGIALFDDSRTVVVIALEPAGLARTRQEDAASGILCREEVAYVVMRSMKGWLES